MHQTARRSVPSFLVVNEAFDEWRRGWNFENEQLVSSRDNRGKVNGLARVIIAATPGKDALKPKEDDRKLEEIIVTANIRGMKQRELRFTRMSEGTPEATLAPDDSAPRATDVYDSGVPPVD